MLFDDVATAVAGVPHMTRKQGRALYDFVLADRPRDILELGFASGVSACYMAAALQELGAGHITTIDRKQALDRDPSIHTLLERAGLARYVTPIVADTSYTWELKNLLRRESVPSYDFCFVDGAHTWDVDALAFLLADRMLAPGGWVLFDDLDWTLASSPTLKQMTWVRNLPEVQQTTAQVREVFEVLVRSHREYDELTDKDGWGWARKRGRRP